MQLDTTRQLADPTPRLAEANRQVEAARIALREAEWGGRCPSRERRATV